MLFPSLRMLCSMRVKLGSYWGGRFIGFSRSRNLVVCLVVLASLTVIAYVSYGSIRQKDKSLAVDLANQLQLYQSQLTPESSNSTCSHSAYLRGFNQKVIGYSIYGDFARMAVVEKYLYPFGETLRMIPLVYPGWIVRIYHNFRADNVETWKILLKVIDFERNKHVDLCNTSEIIERRKFGGLYPMTWRWLPLLDEMVDTFMSRDSDSRIIARELHAVRQWLTGNRIYHIMRDHPSHCRVILGGCWGVKVNQNRSTIVDAALKMFRTNHRYQYDYDQKLLEWFVWPIAQENMIAHDSYCCEKIGLSQPFPTKREGGYFVSWRAVPQEALRVHCPLRCRPQNVTSSSDWNYC